MTASAPQSHHDYSFADYLALERDSEIKHEFDSGEILAMAGGTARHSALAAKIIIALGTSPVRGCTVFQSDIRVRIAATGRATYLDVSMVRGPIEYDSDDATRTTITNPVLLPRIEVYRRMPSGTWEYFEVREGIVSLASGPALDLSMLYADLPV
jgi:Uma2 family endonuclease